MTKKWTVSILIVCLVVGILFFKSRSRPLEDYDVVSFLVPSVKNSQEAELIFAKLLDKEGVVQIVFQNKKENILVYFDSELVSDSQVKRRLQKAGYRIIRPGKASKLEVLDYKVKYNPNY